MALSVGNFPFRKLLLLHKLCLHLSTYICMYVGYMGTKGHFSPRHLYVHIYCFFCFQANGFFLLCCQPFCLPRWWLNFLPHIVVQKMFGGTRKSMAKELWTSIKSILVGRLLNSAVKCPWGILVDRQSFICVDVCVCIQVSGFLFF